jgi:hypothetical protein
MLYLYFFVFLISAQLGCCDSEWIQYPDSGSPDYHSVFAYPTIHLNIIINSFCPVGIATMTHYTLPLDFVAACGCAEQSTHYPTAAMSQMAYGFVPSPVIVPAR